MSLRFLEIFLFYFEDLLGTAIKQIWGINKGSQRLRSFLKMRFFSQDTLGIRSSFNFEPTEFWLRNASSRYNCKLNSSFFSSSFSSLILSYTAKRNPLVLLTHWVEISLTKLTNSLDIFVFPRVCQILCHYICLVFSRIQTRFLTAIQSLTNILHEGF